MKVILFTFVNIMKCKLKIFLPFVVLLAGCVSNIIKVNPDEYVPSEKPEKEKFFIMNRVKVIKIEHVFKDPTHLQEESDSLRQRVLNTIKKTLDSIGFGVMISTGAENIDTAAVFNEFWKSVKRMNSRLFWPFQKPYVRDTFSTDVLSGINSEINTDYLLILDVNICKYTEAFVLENGCMELFFYAAILYVIFPPAIAGLTFPTHSKTDKSIHIEIIEAKTGRILLYIYSSSMTGFLKDFNREIYKIFICKKD